MPPPPEGDRPEDFRNNVIAQTRTMRRQSTAITNEKDDDSELSECECQTRQYPPWTGEIHGMSQALLSKSKKLRAFWWLVLFVCTSCGTATTVLVVLEYLDGPTATSTTIRLVSSLQLPAITVCPKVPDALDFDGIFSDMRTLIPDISNQTALDVVRFWLAGSGLENIDAINDYNRTYLDDLSVNFNKWSEGYNPKEFFDLMQTKHGYTCDELFYYCELGGKAKNCCTDMFRKRSVMRRGLCFQTLPNVNQTEADDIGRLVLLMKSPKSIISPQYNYTQPQIIIYINDNFDYVLDFPRFYLYPNEWNRMHFTARLVELLEHPKDCTSDIEGKDTACFVRNWLNSNLIDQFNCTLPYLTEVPDIPARNVCDPLVVVREYFNTIQLVHSGSVHSQECVPGCKRWEYGVSLQQSQALDNFTGFKFNLEASFYDLQYEHVKEVYTTSVPGFMSQIGGQFGFFLGLSIITMIQIGIYLISYVFNFFYKLFKQPPDDDVVDGVDPTVTDMTQGYLDRQIRQTYGNGTLVQSEIRRSVNVNDGVNDRVNDRVNDGVNNDVVDRIRQSFERKDYSSASSRNNDDIPEIRRDIDDSNIRYDSSDSSNMRYNGSNSSNNKIRHSNKNKYNMNKDGTNNNGNDIRYDNGNNQKYDGNIRSNGIKNKIRSHSNGNEKNVNNNEYNNIIRHRDHSNGRIVDDGLQMKNGVLYSSRVRPTQGNTNMISSWM